MPEYDDDLLPLPALREEVDSLFSEVLGLRPPRRGPAGLWNPRLDLVEEEDRYVLVMDLPGVRQEDLKIEVQGRYLVVSGERRIERESTGPRLRQQERYHGTFKRVVQLTAAVDRERISATLREGILRVELPKRGARP